MERDIAIEKTIAIYLEMNKAWQIGDREASRKLSKQLENYINLNPPKGGTPGAKELYDASMAEKARLSQKFNSAVEAELDKADEYKNDINELEHVHYQLVDMMSEAKKESKPRVLHRKRTHKIAKRS